MASLVSFRKESEEGTGIIMDDDDDDEDEDEEEDDSSSSSVVLVVVLVILVALISEMIFGCCDKWETVWGLEDVLFASWS